MKVIEGKTEGGTKCYEVGIIIIYKQTREQCGIFAVLVIYKSPQRMGGLQAAEKVNFWFLPICLYGLAGRCSASC